MEGVTITGYDEPKSEILEVDLGKEKRYHSDYCTYAVDGCTDTIRPYES